MLKATHFFIPIKFPTKLRLEQHIKPIRHLEFILVGLKLLDFNLWSCGILFLYMYQKGTIAKSLTKCEEQHCHHEEGGPTVELRLTAHWRKSFHKGDRALLLNEPDSH